MMHFITCSAGSRMSLMQPHIFANGRLVWAESGGGATRPVTGPGSLAGELSRRVSRHGAIFANPGK